MKQYTLDSSSKPLAPEQRNAIYWRLWKAAEEAKPESNRFAITQRVVGRIKKIDELTEEEFLKLMRVFERIAKKNNSTADDADHTDKDQEPRLPSAPSAQSAVKKSLSDHQANERNRRERIVRQLLELIGTEENPGKLSQNQAAKIRENKQRYNDAL